MKKWDKRMWAPLLVGLLIIGVCLGILKEYLYISGPVGKLVTVIVWLGLIGLTVKLVLERLEEIRGGEEDDLGKY